MLFKFERNSDLKEVFTNKNFYLYENREIKSFR